MKNKTLVDVIKKFQFGLVSRNFMAMVLRHERKQGKDPYFIYDSLINDNNADDNILPVCGSFDIKMKDGKKISKHILWELDYEEDEIEPRDDF